MKTRNMPDGRIVYDGPGMTAYIPTSYNKYKILSVTDTVTTLGIFEFEEEGQRAPKGVFMPAIVELCPSAISMTTRSGEEHVMCQFTKGDTLFKVRHVVCNPYIAYVVFSEYVENGKVPDWINYETRAFLFDIVKMVTKSPIPANHAVFEAMEAHLSRDPNEVSVYYRLTDMSKSPLRIKLSDTTHAATSVSAKLVGGYLADTINAAITNPNTQESDIENILRQ